MDKKLAWFNKIFLYVCKGNEPVYRFYEKFGFLPRKNLGFKTPKEVFIDELMKQEKYQKLVQVY